MAPYLAENPQLVDLGSGPVLRSKRERHVCGESYVREDYFPASVVAGGNRLGGSENNPKDCFPDDGPILQSADHDFDPVATFVAAPIVSDDLLAILPSGETGLYPFVFQCISQPIGVIAAAGEQRLCGCQAAEQGRGSDRFADLSCSHEEPARPPIGVGIGMQFCVHFAFGAPGQTTLTVIGPLNVVLVETCQALGVLKAMPIKTERREVEGIAGLLHMGWFRPVHGKSVSAPDL